MSSDTNETVNIPNIVRFSFTKCLSENLTITLGENTATNFCAESYEFVMIAPSTNETAIIESDKRDNISWNVTYVNSFENH